MTINRIGAASLAALTLALGLALSPTAAQAYARHTVTTCEPYGINHQRCTVEHYNNGVLMFTSVYYIDENGMWYRMAD